MVDNKDEETGLPILELEDILQKNREGIPQDLRDAAREKLTKERNVRENVIDFPFSPAQPNIRLIKKLMKEKRTKKQNEWQCKG